MLPVAEASFVWLGGTGKGLEIRIGLRLAMLRGRDRDLPWADEADGPSDIVIIWTAPKRSYRRLSKCRRGQGEKK